MTGPQIIDLGRVRLATRTLGELGALPVVLVHGLGQTLWDWPERLLDALAAKGCRVIAFDNRDVGHSSRFDAVGPPPLIRMMLATRLGLCWSPRLAYGLPDMAADVLALLDAFGVSRAHLVGASMGGMIAQRLACARPDRVASLTCIMSSSGAPGLPAADRDVRALLLRNPPRNPDDAIAHSLRLRRRLAGELSAADSMELHDRVARATVYGRPARDGAARQYAAILDDRSRWRALGDVVAPTLVIHGGADPLLPPEHGRDLAWRVPQAAFELIPGMGHEILESRAQTLAALIASHVGRAADQFPTFSQGIANELAR